jgi:hypothetical protein
VVDELNRRVHKMHDIAIIMYMLDLEDRILEVVTIDQHYVHVRESLQQNDTQHKHKDCNIENDGFLLFHNKVYVPNSRELRNLVLKEMHNVAYTGHPGYQETITTIRGKYFCPGMKKYVTDYLDRCMECHNRKAEHRHPTTLLQQFLIHG